jgi:hypothetical protein
MIALFPMSYALRTDASSRCAGAPDNRLVAEDADGRTAITAAKMAANLIGGFRSVETAGNNPRRQSASWWMPPSTRPCLEKTLNFGFIKGLLMDILQGGISIIHNP